MPASTMASELATRIRSKLLTSRRRRHSTASLVSSQSDGSLAYTKAKAAAAANPSTSPGHLRPHDIHPSSPSPSSHGRHPSEEREQQSGSDGDDEASALLMKATTTAAPGGDPASNESRADGDFGGDSGAAGANGSTPGNPNPSQKDHLQPASGPQDQDQQILQHTTAPQPQTLQMEVSQSSTLISSPPTTPSLPHPSPTTQQQPPSQPQLSHLHSIDENTPAPASPTSGVAFKAVFAPAPLGSSGTDINNASHSTTLVVHDESNSPGQKAPAPLVLPPNHVQAVVAGAPHSQIPSPVLLAAAASSRPLPVQRRQSLLPNRHSALIKTLLHGHSAAGGGAGVNEYANDAGSDLHSIIDISAEMVTRKIWVKRPNASATLVVVHEDDLVDDLRELILRKYANSLGRTFDSPDLILHIRPREQQHRERELTPDEPVCRTLDAYFPGGQTVDEALLIEIPLPSASHQAPVVPMTVQLPLAGQGTGARRTPKASPRPPTTVVLADEGRPSEAAEGYFPPVGGLPSPHHSAALQAPTNGPVPHSIAVIGTGQLPQIPSPGGSRPRQHQHPHQLQHRERSERPRVGRTHTSSPTILSNGAGNNGPMTASTAVTANSHGLQHTNSHSHNRDNGHRPSHSRAQSNASDHQNHMPPTAAASAAAANSIGAVPLTASPGPDTSQTTRVATPPPRVASPRPSTNRARRTKRGTNDHPALPPGMLNGGVPPISVLIVEDNPINLKLLEAFVKRLKVRWSTAMNGRDAVLKWKTGGFHLVLMDIQLPIMNGLDATREIRRLERVNSIGVFSSTSDNVPDDGEEHDGELRVQDRLDNRPLFKSPVIIVALTASSLQSDRHEALAAGCNDFLTKPVNFVWLERKVMEWGCMQALIDFDGWRKWKDFSIPEEATDASKKPAPAPKPKPKKKSSLVQAVG